MEFAQKEMKKRGWKRGKGLGKGEHGISDAIKVNLKMDGTGLGYDHGEQFTFRWWDHMFSSALNKIDVAEDEHGEVQVKSEQGADAGNPISTKRIAPKFLAKEMLYGRFVRGTTVTSAAASSASDSDSSSSEDDRPALTFEETDDKLLAACGGRTAHKGARHGLGQSGKLARLEQQEAAFYGAPEPVKTSKSELETAETIGKKKKKRKRHSEKEEEDDLVIEERPKKQRKQHTEEKKKSKQRSGEKKKGKQHSEEKKKRKTKKKKSRSDENGSSTD